MSELNAGGPIDLHCRWSTGIVWTREAYKVIAQWQSYWKQLFPLEQRKVRDIYWVAVSDDKNLSNLHSAD